MTGAQQDDEQFRAVLSNESYFVAMGATSRAEAEAEVERNRPVDNGLDGVVMDMAEFRRFFDERFGL